jgi:hypothetical protein
MKNLLFVCLTVLFACQEAKSTEELTEAGSKRLSMEEQNVPLQELTIDFARVALKIPSSYESTSIDEMVMSIQASDLEQEDKNVRIKAVRNIGRFPGQVYLYTDTMNVFNMFLAMEVEYIYISRRMASDYLSQLEWQMEQQWEGNGDMYKKLDSKYLHRKSKEIVKVSYQLSANETASYMTQYIVSTKDKSMVLLVTAQDYVDLEEQVKKLKVL